MNILKIPFYTELDTKLEEIWHTTDDTPDEWTDFIKYLDKNIIDVKAEHVPPTTSITFSKPEHISWFLLRWS